MSQPAAAADDGKSYAGGICHERFAGQANSVVRGGDGFINIGTGTVTAECPIVRDGIINGRINRAFVRVVDNSQGANVSCTLFSQSFNGGLHQFQTQVSASGTNPAGQTLVFTAMQAVNSGVYHLACQIPPNGPGGASRIVSYRVDEEN